MNSERAGQLEHGLLFWQLWLRSLTERRPQAALAIGSILAGAALTSMLLNLHHDVRRKMTREFRAYGANVTLSAPAATMDSGNLAGVMDEEIMGRLKPFKQQVAGLEALPIFSTVVRVKRVPPDARLEKFENTIAVGTDFPALRRLYASWRVEGAASTLQPGTCALGSRLARQLRLGVGEGLEIESAQPGEEHAPAERRAFRIASVLSTGASEDDQIFVPLNDLQRLAGFEHKLSLVQLNVPGETAGIERVVGELSQAFPGLEVRPIRQIVYSEGKVLETIRWLLVSLTALIVITIGLCVAATMTAIVLDRRKDIAVMKALGATDHLVMRLFLSEGAGLGLAGGIAGFVVGGFLARILAKRLFDVSLNLTWWTLPLIGVSSMLLGALATLFPVKIVRGVQPATVLKGE